MKSLPVRTALLLVMIFFLTGCPDWSDEGGGSADQEPRVLYVTLHNGVTGTPANGTYQYDQDTTVDYSYSLKAGYRDLEVSYDSNDAPADGSINVDIGYHYLDVESTKMDDIRGQWTGFHEYVYYRFFLVVTFSGDYLAGETTGATDQIETDNGRGDYTVCNDETEIEFSLAFTTYGITYHFKGTIENKNKMSGTYTTEPAKWFGNWELEK